MATSSAEVRRPRACGPGRPPWRSAAQSSRSRPRRRRPDDPGSAARSRAHPAASRRPERRRRAPLTPEAGRCREPGTRSMSPKEQKITSGRAAIAQRLVDHLERGDADRTAGPVDQLDPVGQQLVQPVLDDRVGLPAADLHQRPRRVVVAWMSSTRRLRDLGILVLLRYLTRCRPILSRGIAGLLARRDPIRSPNSASSSPICRKISRSASRLLVEALERQSRRGRRCSHRRSMSGT